MKRFLPGIGVFARLVRDLDVAIFAAYTAVPRVGPSSHLSHVLTLACSSLLGDPVPPSPNFSSGLVTAQAASLPSLHASSLSKARRCRAVAMMTASDDEAPDKVGVQGEFFPRQFRSVTMTLNWAR